MKDYAFRFLIVSSTTLLGAACGFIFSVFIDFIIGRFGYTTLEINIVIGAELGLIYGIYTLYQKHIISKRRKVLKNRKIIISV